MTIIRHQDGYWDAVGAALTEAPAPAELTCCAGCGAALDDDNCDSSDTHVCRGDTEL